MAASVTRFDNQVEPSLVQSPPAGAVVETAKRDCRFVCLSLESRSERPLQKRGLQAAPRNPNGSEKIKWGMTS
ncbi:hypothetical protein DSCW_04520 [Desulfosarcina widdelii]|uniref:Uncharacterized protein n=1 Tax=Desulfosarcina widdelii TaxID=947919 RepID=A0A5K7YXA5_9BACT|nr:hypothetical protein [Desulfosarcina widdelii]BBO73035.1 hypothetical protein DSCW_04520 [Desulfosarcina widdelii]